MPDYNSTKPKHGDWWSFRVCSLVRTLTLHCHLVIEYKLCSSMSNANWTIFQCYSILSGLRATRMQGWQLKKKQLLVGFIGFFKCNKTYLPICLHPASQDLQNSPNTQVKLSTSCRITSPMYHVLHYWDNESLRPVKHNIF